jgi:phospholipase D1/2
MHSLILPFWNLMLQSNAMSPPLPPIVRKTAYKRNAVISLLISGFVVGCLWRFTSWHEKINFATLVGWGQSLQGHPWTPYVVVGVFILGGLLFFFHALLLWVVVFTFDTQHAALYCVLGSLLSASTLYWLGRVLRKDVVARIAGSHAEQISKALARKGIITLILLHIFPVLPFSALNLLAGATHITFFDFVAGTLLGMVPGITILLIFGNSFLQMLKQPTWTSFAGLAVFVAVGAYTLSRLRKKLLPKEFE